MLFHRSQWLFRKDDRSTRCSRHQVNRAIDSIIREQNITVILAAHRLSSIARAEQVIVLENGVVSEKGRYDVLVSGLGFPWWRDL